MAVDYVIQTKTSLKNNCAFFFNWRILLLTVVLVSAIQQSELSYGFCLVSFGADC